MKPAAVAIVGLMTHGILSVGFAWAVLWVASRDLHAAVVMVLSCLLFGQYRLEWMLKRVLIEVRYDRER